MREEGYHFSCQTFQFYEFFRFKCLPQLFHHLRNFIRYLKKASSDITTKNPLAFWCLDIRWNPWYCPFDPTVLFQAEWNLLPQPIAIIFDIPCQKIKALADFHFCSSHLLKMASARDQKTFLDQLMATMGVLPSLETEKVSSLPTKSIYSKLLLLLLLFLLLLFLLLF